MNVEILTISDIHFGYSENAKSLLSQLEGVFMQKVIDLRPNMIAVVGDLIDKKLTLNSSVSHDLQAFATKLILICNKFKIHLRFIQGTYSHDLDQLKNFEALTNNYFKIIYSAKSEEILIDDKNILRCLYIPEEYPKNKNDFYEPFFRNKYDVVFMHGTIKSLSFMNQQILSEKHIHSAPIFDEAELTSISDGPVLCGHIHTPQNYKNKIYYNGSFTRFHFNETEDKGFLHTTMNLDTKEYKVNFIVNTMALKYKTIDISLLKNSFDNTENMLQYIDELQRTNDFVKIKNVDSDELITQLMKKKYDDSSVKIEKAKVDLEKERDNTFDFILEKTLRIEEEVQKFIEITEGKNIELDRIIKILNGD